jgi:Fic family protein
MDIKADILAAQDRGESITLMEPMLIPETSRHKPRLADLAIELTQKATRFCSSLPTGVHDALADLVRAMNCYYSNLIEGHDTHPVDIERALKNDYSAEVGKRNLQLEAKAHIVVQKWINEGGLSGCATTIEGLCEIHRRFCEPLPEELLWVEKPDTGEKIQIEPGKLRDSVGNHVAVSPGALRRFLNRFEEVYTKLGKASAIIGAALAHHRLLWIHPFLDGNGRVARLMSHAMLLEMLDTGGIWSVARGLARNVSAYKSHLANCDLPRRNDLDGRGNLSEEALAKSPSWKDLCNQNNYVHVSLNGRRKKRNWAISHIKRVRF